MMTSPVRDAAIVARLTSPERPTLAAVGLEFGLTRERVRQIAKIRAGLTMRALPTRAKTDRSLRVCPTCGVTYRRADFHEHVRTREHLCARFWPQVARSGAIPAFAPELGSCWIWTGPSFPTQAGFYGNFQTPDKTTNAHRMAYGLTNGPVPAGLTLDHLCRVTLCVNPAHLEAVTQKENVRRGKNGVLRYLKAPRPISPTDARGHVLAETRGKNGQCRLCDKVRSDRYRARLKARTVA